METSLVKIEKLSFHTDKLFCPVIENEPMVIMNLIINNIGLSYKSQIDNIQNSRFSIWTQRIQLIKEEKSEIQPPLRWIKIEKTGEKPRIFEIQSTLWDTIFLEIGGYEYVVLPIRKLAGWLYSINPNRVNSEVRSKLEMYQEECDEVLYQHFFGVVSKRKNILIEKSDISFRISNIEADLSQIPLFADYINLKAEEMRLGKVLKQLDRDVITNQKSLFDEN